MALPPANFKNLTKTDRRKQWKLLKGKHKAAIAAAKLDFDLKLGPALDKYQTQVDKLTKLADTTKLADKHIQPVLVVAWPLRKIVDSYATKVQQLKDPAKKELSAVLNAIEADITSWEKLALALQSQMPTAATDPQQTAAGALVIPLDNLRGVANTVVTRGERAQLAYEQNQPNARLGAAELTGALIAAARLAGPAAHELATAAGNASAGANYDLFKARAEALITPVRAFRNATQAFLDEWAITDSPDMTITNNVDAMALKGNAAQILEYCKDILKKISRLP